jgi:hypothetical protein
MSRKSPKSLSELIFRPGSALNELARQAEATVDLAAALRGAIAPALAAELRSASLHDDGTLVVMVTSSAWAARLRFEGEALLGRCRECHPATTRLEVRVASPGVPGKSG